MEKIKEKLDDMDKRERYLMIENEDKKQDAQRLMAWVSLFGMIAYPFLIVIASYLGFDKAVSSLTEISGAYFFSVAAIVAAFYGKEAFVSNSVRKTSSRQQYQQKYDIE